MSDSLKHVSLFGITIKEGGVRRTLVATTHPDRENDILTKEVLQQIADAINDTSKAGDQNGGYRLISYAHDWVRGDDPTLPPMAFFVPGTASIVSMKDGHFGVEADFELNKAYKQPTPKHPTIEEADYLIEKGEIAGMSIEFYAGTKQKITVKDQVYTLIKNITQFCGAGLARARMIANPHAVIYKEIEEASGETYINEEAPKVYGQNMSEQEETLVSTTPSEVSPSVETIVETVADAPISTEPLVATEESISQEAPQGLASTETSALPETATAPSVEEEQPAKEVLLDAKETINPPPSPEAISIKEATQKPDFKEAVLANMHIKSKVRITDKEDSMEGISVKELNAAITAGAAQFKEVAEQYVAANEDYYFSQMKGVGLPLNITMQVKCSGKQLKINSGMKVKDTLNTTTNVSTYTQNMAEFADLYQPGIVDTFNNQTNLWAALDKVPNLEGSQKFGWTMKQDRKTGLSINPDIVTVNSDPLALGKYQTAICEYRVGVIVTDYVLQHSRAGLGDLMQAELNARLNDLMVDINTDLFTGQSDTGTKVIGLKAVADSTTYPTMYGLTRSVANRLSVTTLTTTYVNASGAGTQAALRLGIDNVQVEGTRFKDLLIVCSPTVRSYLFTIMGARQYIDNATAIFGFDRSQNTTPTGMFLYDGIPVLVDPDCTSGELYVIDRSVAKIVISRAPQMIGLAKIGAAQGAYLSAYIAFVYEQPRRIFAYVGLTSFSA